MRFTLSATAPSGSTVAVLRPMLVLAACLLALTPVCLTAQEDPGRSPDDSASVNDTLYASSIGGEFRPAKGFDLVRTKRGSLNISFYGLFRYMNQLPSSQTFTDHLGRERDVKLRNDLNWHRTFVSRC